MMTPTADIKMTLNGRKKEKLESWISWEIVTKTILTSQNRTDLDHLKSGLNHLEPVKMSKIDSQKRSRNDHKMFKYVIHWLVKVVQSV